MRVMGIHRLTIAPIIVASLLLPHGVLADTAPRHGSSAIGQVTRTIDYSGIDLSTPAGAQRLYREIVRTAKRICWSSGRDYRGVVRAHYQTTVARRCFEEAVDGALVQVTARTGTDLELAARLDRFREAGLVASR